MIFRAKVPCQNRFFVSERRIILNFALQNHLRPVSLPSKIEIVATSSQRPLPTALSKITQGNLFREWFLRWWARLIWIWSGLSATDNQIPPSKMPSRNRVSKDQQASSMFILSSKSNVCLAFFFCQEQGYCQFQIKSDHMRIIFRSVLHGLLWAYALRQALSSDNLQRTSHSWKDFSTMDRQGYCGMESNSSPSSQPESIRKMVAPTTVICVTPSVR